MHHQQITCIIFNYLSRLINIIAMQWIIIRFWCITAAHLAEASLIVYLKVHRNKMLLQDILTAVWFGLTSTETSSVTGYFCLRISPSDSRNAKKSTDIDVWDALSWCWVRVQCQLLNIYWARTKSGNTSHPMNNNLKNYLTRPDLVSSKDGCGNQQWAIYLTRQFIGPSGSFAPDYTVHH